MVGEDATSDTKSKWRRRLRDGEFEQNEIEVEVSDVAGSPIGQFDMPGMPPGQVINLSEMMKGLMGNRPRQKRRMTVEAARKILEAEEADQLLDNEQLTKDAVSRTRRTTASCSSTRSTRFAREVRKGGVPRTPMFRVKACSVTYCR